MSDYQSLARKFRPQLFQDVCEQKAIITTLKNAISLGRVSHAYLFCGPRGVGKTTLARLFAKALNCQHLTEDFEPCNTCSCCKEITYGQSLDVLEIDGASNRGIDAIRELTETTLYSPSSSRYKIYIIDEVHMLTKEAFNALLKTLEEPPKNVKFFFATTEPHKVLPTILSRCQRFDLHRISLETLCHKLRAILTSLNMTIEDEALYTLAKCADGSLRDGESLLDQMLCTEETRITFSHVANLLGLASKEALFILDNAFHTQDLKTAFTLANTLYEEGKDLVYFIELLADHYQMILKHHLGVSIASTLPSSDRDHYINAASIYSKDQCLYILEYLIQWMDKFHRMSCKHIHLELILVHIIRSKQRIPLDYLVKTIEKMKKELVSVQAPIALSTELVKEFIPVQAKEENIIPPSPIQEVLEAVVETSKEEPPKQESSDVVREEPIDLNDSQKYETLLRFASVELNGVFRKAESTYN